MANQTGVTSSETHHETHRQNGAGGKVGGKKETKKEKNKKLLLIGGAGALLLFMSHKGSGASGTNDQQTQSALQAEADALAAEQAALSGGSVVPGGLNTDGTGGGGSSDGGSTQGVTPSGSGNTETGSGTTTEGEGGAAATGTGTTGSNKRNRKKYQKKRHPKKNDGNRSQQAAHPDHHGHGAVVHGRTFPGARGIHVGPTQRNGTTVTNRVTVNYGGHSDVHTSVNQGRSWIDHSGGPPSRRPPTIRAIGPNSTTAVHRSAPRPAPRRAPVHRRHR